MHLHTPHCDLFNFNLCHTRSLQAIYLLKNKTSHFFYSVSIFMCWIYWINGSRCVLCASRVFSMKTKTSAKTLIESEKRRTSGWRHKVEKEQAMTELKLQKEMTTPNELKIFVRKFRRSWKRCRKYRIGDERAYCRNRILSICRFCRKEVEVVTLSVRQEHE